MLSTVYLLSLQPPLLFHSFFQHSLQPDPWRIPRAFAVPSYGRGKRLRQRMQLQPRQLKRIGDG